MNFHKLLSRQLKEFLPGELQNHPGLEKLLAAINDCYIASDIDTTLSDMAFKISEEEYIKVNRQLKQEAEVKKLSIEKLKEAVGTITGIENQNDTDDLLVIARFLNQQVGKRKNAEKIFTSLITNMQSGILLEDEVNHIVFTNQIFCDIFNIPVVPEAMQGADWSNSAEVTKKLFKDADAFVSGVAGLLEEKKLVTGQIIEMADGKILQRDYIPIFLDGKHKGQLWSYTDITEKKKVQDALIKSELTNRLIMNASLDAIVIINDKGEIVFWNPQAEKTFGWKKIETRGHKLSEIIIPGKLQQAHNDGLLGYNITGTGPVPNKIIEIAAVNKAGAEFPVELSVVPIKQEAGMFFCGFIRDISERKKAELDLKASEELWQFALEGAGDGVWEYNFETNEAFFSRQYKKMLGYEEDEFANEENEWFKRIHPGDLTIIKATDEDYLNNKITSHQREYRLKHRDGHYLWILDRGKVINYTAAGKPERIIGTHTDITERKQAEEEYRRISVVASANENGVVFTDAEGKIFWSNEGFVKLTGYTNEEIIGKTPLELGEGPLSKSDALLSMVTAFFEGRSFNVELVHYKKDNSWFWARVTGQAMLDTNGRVVQYFAIIEDITYEKEIEQTLKLKEEKYRSIIANMNLGLLEVDDEEKIQFANQSLCDMSGYTLNELIGKKASTLFAKEKDEEYIESKNELRKKGISDAYEICLKNKNGETKWWLISGAPRYNDNGDLVGTIGIHLDITEQKLLELELIDAREQAESSVNAKQMFLANMSHEIRTPMNAILGMTNQLDKTKLTSEQHFYLSTIHSAADNLLIIINDILDLSKIDAGKLTLEKIGFEPKTVMNRVMQVMEHRAEEKGLDFISSGFDEDLSPVLLGDPYRLNQVLLNLISNAIKFTQKGTVDITCKMLADDASKQTIAFTVADTGIGMDESFAKNLFDKFSQEDSSIIRKYGGTGLGMSICKELVDLMNGSIQVNSKKNVGTSISVIIDFEKGSIKDLPLKEVVATDTSLLKGKKILVTDDNEMNQLVAATILLNYGAEITEAFNGAEAIEKIKSTAFDLVLMDVQMPVMDGIEAIKIIRKNVDKHLPVVALTAYAINGDNQKCIAAGMNDYLSKPFEESQLLNIVSKWLGKSLLKEKDTAVKVDEAALYDLSKLNEIARGNEAFINKMIKLFIEQIPAATAAIQAAYLAKDFDSIKRTAHRIKPSIDNMGINSLTKVVREIETLALSNANPPRLLQLVQKLDSTLKKVVTALQARPAA
jgi:PAS domain S-box-containing protein